MIETSGPGVRWNKYKISRPIWTPGMKNWGPAIFFQGHIYMYLVFFYQIYFTHQYWNDPTFWSPIWQSYIRVHSSRVQVWVPDLRVWVPDPQVRVTDPQVQVRVQVQEPESEPESLKENFITWTYAELGMNIVSIHMYMVSRWFCAFKICIWPYAFASPGY